MIQYVEELKVGIERSIGITLQRRDGAATSPPLLSSGSAHVGVIVSHEYCKLRSLLNDAVSAHALHTIHSHYDNEI
jgi:hypothetical protein